MVVMLCNFKLQEFPTISIGCVRGFAVWASMPHQVASAMQLGVSSLASHSTFAYEQDAKITLPLPGICLHIDAQHGYGFADLKAQKQPEKVEDKKLYSSFTHPT